MTASNVVRLGGTLALGTVLAMGAALPTAASAQTPSGRLPAGALLVVDGSGQPVGVLVPSDGAERAAPTAGLDPMAEMMALQDAMMRQMQAQMAGLVQRANDAGPGDLTSGLVIRSVTTGPDGCSRTVVWRQGPADRAPRMVLDRIADRCGAGGQAPGARPLPDAAPAGSGPAIPGLQTIVDVHAPAKAAAKRPF